MAKKIQQWEQKEYIDKYTGEVKQVIEITKETDRNGFMVTYILALADALELIGSKKTKILGYILENMDYNNILYISNRKLAKECEVSTSTISLTLKALREADIISTQTNLIMLNPKLGNKVSKAKEQALMIRFKEIKEGDL